MSSQGARKEINEDAASPSGGSLRQMVLFALVGIVNTAVDLAAFAVLLWIGLAPLAANAISFSLGALNSLILNKNLTFREAGAHYSPRLVFSFAAVTLLSLGVSQASLSALMTMGAPALAAKLASVLVTFVVGFGLNKFVTFRKSSQHG
ncbi:GtrA family protein [Aureimonas sp. AU20]|uniref:GtrA family protein n=1 Tax=Aureimonas sp. AU20 TaxID=1349819 RepID=UPI0009EB7C57|nr:GtrA family protein [Aureimonas sp. AU20]